MSCGKCPHDVFNSPHRRFSKCRNFFFNTRNNYWARSLGFLIPVQTSEPGTLVILPPSCPRSQPEYVLVVVRPGPGCELVPGEPVRTRVWLVGEHCGPSPGFDDLLRHGQATKDMLVETCVPRSTNQACANAFSPVWPARCIASLCRDPAGSPCRVHGQLDPPPLV
jgi:hypothetical protein